MSVQNLELIAGKLIVFSTGEYSDYGYWGAYVVLQNVPHEEIATIAQIVEEKAQANDVEQNKTYDWSLETDPKSLFVAELIRRGFLADIDLREIHLGSYNELDIS